LRHLKLTCGIVFVSVINVRAVAGLMLVVTLMPNSFLHYVSGQRLAFHLPPLCHQETLPIAFMLRFPRSASNTKPIMCIMTPTAAWVIWVLK
jgi:hypothetical protein